MNADAMPGRRHNKGVRYRLLCAEAAKKRDSATFTSWQIQTQLLVSLRQAVINNYAILISDTNLFVVRNSHRAAANLADCFIMPLNMDSAISMG
jgi:hypothetical protein